MKKFLSVILVAVLAFSAVFAITAANETKFETYEFGTEKPALSGTVISLEAETATSFDDAGGTKTIETNEVSTFSGGKAITLQVGTSASYNFTVAAEGTYSFVVTYNAKNNSTNRQAGYKIDNSEILYIKHDPTASDFSGVGYLILKDVYLSAGEHTLTAYSCDGVTSTMSLRLDCFDIALQNEMSVATTTTPATTADINADFPYTIEFPATDITIPEHATLFEAEFGDMYKDNETLTIENNAEACYSGLMAVTFQKGTGATYEFEIETAGKYNLVLLYNAKDNNNNRQQGFAIDGAEPSYVRLEHTGSDFLTLGQLVIKDIELSAGEHTLKICAPGLDVSNVASIRVDCFYIYNDTASAKEVEDDTFVTTAATTTASATTAASTTTAGTMAAATTTEASAQEEGGCGSSIGFASAAACSAVLGASVIVCRKKRKY